MAVRFDSSLEKKLHDRIGLDPIQGEEAQELWEFYAVARTHLKRHYYPWVQATCPYFTDHGSAHIRSVGNTVALLLQEPSETLDPFELFILLMSVLWHDVGMVLGRTNHAEKAFQVEEKLRSIIFFHPKVGHLVESIVKAHTGTDTLGSLPHEDNCMGLSMQHVVKTRALAALLRFADEISETCARVEPGLLPRVPKKNLIFWHYALSVVSSMPELKRRRVVIEVVVDHDLATTRFECAGFGTKPTCADCSSSPEVLLNRYILCRLEKVVNEQLYCCPAFSNYVRIQEVEARLALREGTKRIPASVVQMSWHGLPYPNTTIAKGFFDGHPYWQDLH